MHKTSKSGIHHQFQNTSVTDNKQCTTTLVMLLLGECLRETNFLFLRWWRTEPLYTTWLGKGIQSNGGSCWPNISHIWQIFFFPQKSEQFWQIRTMRMTDCNHCCFSPTQLLTTPVEKLHIAEETNTIIKRQKKNILHVVMMLTSTLYSGHYYTGTGASVKNCRSKSGTALHLGFPQSEVSPCTVGKS